MTPEIKEYVDKALSEKLKTCFKTWAYWGMFAVGGALLAWLVFSFFFAHIVWRW